MNIEEKTAIDIINSIRIGSYEDWIEVIKLKLVEYKNNLIPILEEKDKEIEFLNSNCDNLMQVIGEKDSLLRECRDRIEILKIDYWGNNMEWDEVNQLLTKLQDI